MTKWEEWGKLEGVAEVIDLQDASTRVRGNDKLFARLLSKLLLDDNFDLLKKHVAQGDTAEAQHNAHTIKGVAANLSLKPLSEAAFTVEKEARAGAVTGESVEALGAQYENAMAVVKRICEA